MTTTLTTPAIEKHHCRLCGSDLGMMIQPAMMAHKPSILLATCENKRCVMVGQTIRLDTHANGDIEIYTKKAVAA